MSMMSSWSWYCDTCEDKVGRDGLLTFRTSGKSGVHYRDFQIVHKGNCDPGAPAGFLSSLQLDTVQDDGQAMLLSWLSVGPLKGGGVLRIRTEDMDAFVDTFRRLYVPFYEEARRHFSDLEVRSRSIDATESSSYRPEVLQAIAAGTLGNDVGPVPADEIPADDDTHTPPVASDG